MDHVLIPLSEKEEHIKNKMWRPVLFYEKQKPAPPRVCVEGRNQLKPQAPRRPINVSEKTRRVSFRPGPASIKRLGSIENRQ
jgi:hypothetical protein